MSVSWHWAHSYKLDWLTGLEEEEDGDALLTVLSHCLSLLQHHAETYFQEHCFYFLFILFFNKYFYQH